MVKTIKKNKRGGGNFLKSNFGSTTLPSTYGTGYASQALTTTGQAVGIGLVGTAETIKTTAKVAVTTANNSVHTVGAVIEGVLTLILAVFETLTATFIRLPNDFNSIVKKYMTTNNETVKEMCRQKLLAIFKKISKISNNLFKLISEEYPKFEKNIASKTKELMTDAKCKQTFINRTFRSKFNFSGGKECALNTELKQILEKIKNKLRNIVSSLGDNKKSIKTLNKAAFDRLQSLLTGPENFDALLSFMSYYKKDVDQTLNETKLLLLNERSQKNLTKSLPTEEKNIHDLLHDLKEGLKQVRNSSKVNSENISQKTLNTEKIKQNITNAVSVNSRKLKNYEITNGQNNKTSPIIQSSINSAPAAG